MGVRAERYTTVHALYLSFFSRPFYRDVAENWKGTAFVYLLLLLAVCWIPPMFKFQGYLNRYMDLEAPKIIAQVPVIKISGGNVSTEVSAPSLIKDPDTGMTLMIIDTSGQTTTLDGSDARMLLTRDRLIMRRSARETRSFDLSWVKDLTITKQTLRDWAELLRRRIIFFLYPLALLFSYVYRIGQGLLYAFAAFVLARSLGFSLSYGASVSLSLVSMTPAVIVNTIYDYLGLSVPLWWLLSMALSLGYLWFGVTSNIPEHARRRQ
ncbi:MAG: DUF1189 family protein [Thermodesulfovibrionales bacterium]